MIDDIIQIFKDNQNKWMTYKEVFNALNERKFNWGSNIKGSIGHKNIVSRELSERHRDKFEIDKRFRPQKYRLKNFNNKEIENEISIDLDINDNDGEDEITEFVLDIDNLEFKEYDSPSGIEIREPSVKIKEKGRKINYDKKSRRNKKKGDIGEEAVVLLEKNKLMELGRVDLSEQVEWVSKEKGDGLGYDIISWNVKDGEWNKIYIEVKTTEDNINTPFDISDTEVRVSEMLAENYYIYRVLGIGSVISTIKYYTIKGSVKDNFNLIPILYKAYLKTNENT
ncbi:DUF3883 domain-containing protein [Clostridium septicum]|uniref:DUF3883 domain-containing protein n=1 Tax=Clostridium septicum TaxID=1504 RepID=A0A9N7PL95_CLOSE|nr:DUF3883 domain-containing protein [Clostridium septicum]AYE33647.1 hypothetical protein CP523_03770 [Clostridium septicum]UEC21741.1 DUF3883 domain-containing protein [Clostridium septicum]USS00207.1 DUF3883 domain-containing protein [Clostridium septicum]